MRTISLRLPELLHRQVRDLAQREGISINQFAATAIAEKPAVLMAGDYLEKRAGRGDRAKFEQALAKVGSLPSDAEDAL